MPKHMIDSAELSLLLYQNIGDQILVLKEHTQTSSPEQAIEGLSSGDIEVSSSIRIEQVLISQQLAILSDLNISESVRDLEFEEEARQWAFILEEAGVD